MKSIAIILIAMLFAGCVSTSKPQPISKHNWQQLQADLRDAPPKLQRPIFQTGEVRLRSQDSDAPPRLTEFQSSQTLLIDILSHAHNQVLLPNSKFEKARDVVAGDNMPLQQSFSAALSDYLLQPDFGCHQPIYARYFTDIFAEERRQKQCLAEVPFSVLTRYDGSHVVWLDPRRVVSIHLLFASRSASLASQFGHVALRLVICPEGKPTTEECDANLADHLVLGFRAYINELSINTLKALSGEYKAYLFASHFFDVYEEYTIDEFRDLYSLPLRLNEAQRALMVRELADIHWRYAGKYRFFTRNCATMLQNALRITWPEFAHDETVSSNYLRPDSLFEAIKSSSLAFGDRLNALDVAERNGFFFPNTRQFYDRAVLEVRNAMKKPAFSDLHTYLQTHPVKRRMDRAEDIDFSLKLVSDKHLREAQIMLEEYAVLYSERLLLIEGAKYIDQQNFLSKANSILSQLDFEHAKVLDDCLLAPIRERTNPVMRSKGIPNKLDIPAVSGQTSVCKTEQSKVLLHEAIAGIKDTDSEYWQRLNDISGYCAKSIENLNLLKQL